MRLDENLPKLHLTSLLFLALTACGSDSADKPPPSSPSPSDPPAQVEVVALELVGSCTAQACGTPPSSSATDTPSCAENAGTCAWHTDAPSDTVSFRQCADTECAAAKPDATVCPSGTTFKGATCGSENDAACVWRSACTPPPSTTPCPDEDGCGPMPLIGVICKDGSTGGLACMKKGASCGWERTCE